MGVACVSGKYPIDGKYRLYELNYAKGVRI